MGGEYKKSYISLDELSKHNDDVKTVIECLDYATNENNFDFALLHKQLMLFRLGKKVTDGSPKLDLEFKEEQQPSITTVVRNYQNDRSFKLDTIKIGEFSREHDKKLEEATIHIGMSADEYARSFNALALTVGRDIYFRNGAYKPESEEGRKILAHELTHVSQNEEKEEFRNADKKELENQAVREEQVEEYKSEQLIDYKINGKIYRLTARQIKEIEEDSLKEMEEWVLNQERYLSPEKFLQLLLDFEQYEEQQRWQMQ